MFKQGKPDGPNDHYQVHIADNRESTRMRDRLLANNQTKALCGNGSYHKWFATNPKQVTCPRCQEINQGLTNVTRENRPT